MATSTESPARFQQAEPSLANNSPKASLHTLPAEILLSILADSLTPSFIHTSRQLRSILPPYVCFTKALAAIANCPEGPSSSIMSKVFDRAMEGYCRDSCIFPLTQARRWEVRRAVWSSSWFRARQFEITVLDLYRYMLGETLRLVKPRLSPELVRLKRYVTGCGRLEEIVGEEFVGGVKLKDSVGGRAKGRRKGCKGDLLFTFNSITLLLAEREHRLCFWATTHLYDLPNGLFNLPITLNQLRLMEFLTTLEWHWKATRKSILMPKRNEAFGRAMTWAIAQRNVFCLDVLLALYGKFCYAGNQQALDVSHHIREGVTTSDRRILECLCRGFGFPYSMVDFFESLSTSMDYQQKESGVRCC